MALDFPSSPSLDDEYDRWRWDGTAWVLISNTLGTAADADSGDFEPAGAVSAHESDTTSVHGITNTAALVLTDDSRLSDARTPTAHATTHQTGGADALRIYETIIVAIGDETTALTTGTGKVTFRMPFAMTLTAVRASVVTASSSGLPTFDINEGGTTILSTKLTIDASEKTSTTAATAAVISDASLADDAEITIDIDTAGTGAAGAKIALIGYRT